MTEIIRSDLILVYELYNVTRDTTSHSFALANDCIILQLSLYRAIFLDLASHNPSIHCKTLPRVIMANYEKAFSS